MTTPAPSLRLLLTSLFWPVYLPGFLTATAQTAILVLLPLYVLELGYSPAIAALMMATRGIGQLAGDIPAGIVAGRWGDKTCLMLGAAGYVIGYSLMTLTETPLLLGLGGVIAGIGMSFSLIGRQSYVTSRAPVHQRGRAISLMAGAMRIGSLLGPALGGLAAVQFGYQATFVVLVLLCLLSLLVVLVSADRGEPEVNRTPHSLVAIMHVLTDHRQAFLSAGLAMISLQFMRAGRVVLLPLAGNAIGLSVAEIGLVVAAAALMDSLMFIPAGIIMDRWGRKAAAAPSLLLFACGLAALGWADSYLGLLLSALLIGFANGVSAGLVMVLGSDFAPTTGRARFMGVWKLVSDSGQAAAPLAISAILTVGSLLLCSQLIAATGLIGLYVMASRMNETLIKKH
ncbi:MULTISPECIES: MFS transporter [unclassified Oceanobacter]|uniref:MFS transporter n=1 Tax=unclassified Oceanobacter TaxID=2620260 RepID=UPI0026E1EDC7|nr:MULTISPECIES: MFS transporter [unclassified Oceanobacter]MDO6681769.1 MFS transporter [Oceanobacter sp. 5_MG-2023]MDP2506220.1 MFS transporter [Oceanobacter sp. 3_MG-2023]MDP2546518.1 MFS transporter [Oceanobacter sp. 4_MG-2023]MDP2609694.1 MFS transporter [Oceanobacter sp. 1_MG-2023]MDP2613847.1 MFS transporter [Oceanobacter sp. 2_MG-2023]